MKKSVESKERTSMRQREILNQIFLTWAVLLTSKTAQKIQCNPLITPVRYPETGTNYFRSVFLGALASSVFPAIYPSVKSHTPMKALLCIFSTTYSVRNLIRRAMHRISDTLSYN